MKAYVPGDIVNEADVVITIDAGVRTGQGTAAPRHFGGSIHDCGPQEMFSLLILY